MKVDALKEDVECMVGQRALREDETLVEVMARLDDQASSPDLSNPLRHYLERRSYVKALEYLNEPDTPHRV